MVLSRIETEVNVLFAHLSTEEPNLDFILLHARTLLQLAEGLVGTPLERLSTDSDVRLVRDYQNRLSVEPPLSANDGFLEEFQH